MEKVIISIGICSGVMSIISLCFYALSSLLKNTWSAKRRYIMWIVIFAGFLTPVKPGFFKPLFTVSNNYNVSSSAEAVVNPSHSLSIYLILFVLWLVGFIGFVFYYLLKQYRFYEYASRFAHNCSVSTEEIALKVCQETGTKNARILILSGLSSPAMTGFSFPTVYLPRDNYKESELRLIIKHELTHFVRRDLFFKLLVLVCRSVHWFNPLMPMLSRKFDEACELSCDEAVIGEESHDSKKAYCQAILSAATAEKTSPFPKEPAIIDSFGGGKADLYYRLKLILSHRATKKFGGLCLLVCIMTLFSGTLFGVSGSSPTESNTVETTTNLSKAYAEETPSNHSEFDTTQTTFNEQLTDYRDETYTYYYNNDEGYSEPYTHVFEETTTVPYYEVTTTAPYYETTTTAIAEN